jgi:aminopeptidase N
MSRFIVGVSLLAVFAGNLLAEHLYCHRCAAAFFAAQPDSAEYRKYARDRKIDVEHLKLEVTPDFATHTVSGTSTIRFQPVGMPLNQIELDGVDLTVDSVSSTMPLDSHQVTAEQIILNFGETIKVGQSVEVTIRYSAEPKKGLYFRTPKNGYPKSSQQVWTQGEPHEARHWFPVYDYPNEKFTSEIICHVPKGMTVLSNGKPLGEPVGKGAGITWHWQQDKPHVAYLITLVAGYMEKIEDRHGDLPLWFLTPPEDIHVAKNSFRHTKNMMEFFEREIGVKYPWDIYGQVVVHGFMWGGMENTGMTTLTRRTLFDDTTENVYASDGLIAHELAHQWFGDLLTCKDWSQLWLNEGFATFYDALWHGHFYGDDQFKYEMWNNSKPVLSQKDEKRGIVFRKYGEAVEMFNYLVYPKGAWVLHMLRSQLGPDLYRKAINEYVTRNKFGVVETADLKLVVEEISGRSFDRFFDQWLNGIGAPKLSVSQSWDAKTKLVKVTVKQTQKIGEQNPLFQFPLKLRFKGKDFVVDRQVDVRDKQQDFYVPLKGKPTIVRVDPDYTVLATVDFKKPNTMLYAQLADKGDVMGRIFAVLQLEKKKDRQTVGKLKEALNADAFFGVRTAAAAALRKIHTEEALAALTGSLKQGNAYVRKSVCDAISGFYDPKASAALTQLLESEQNPAVVAAALPGIARWSAGGVRDLALTAAAMDSFRDTAVDGAIGALKTSGDPTLAGPLLGLLKNREADLMDRVFNKGLGALAFLARNESDKGAVREFLTGYIRHRRGSTKVAAIKALATLGDPRVIPALEPFGDSAEGSPEQKAAKDAITKLRAERKTAPEVKDLRKEVEDLKKANQSLKKQFDDFKKQESAKKPAPLL